MVGNFRNLFMLNGTPISVLHFLFYILRLVTDFDIFTSVDWKWLQFNSVVIFLICHIDRNDLIKIFRCWSFLALIFRLSEGLENRIWYWFQNFAWRITSLLVFILIVFHIQRNKLLPFESTFLLQDGHVCLFLSFCSSIPV